MRELTPEEVAAGYRRPLRAQYRHSACSQVTAIGQHRAETFARQPFLYLAAYCEHCMKNFHVSSFKWTDDGEEVGT